MLQAWKLENKEYGSVHPGAANTWQCPNRKCRMEVKKKSDFDGLGDQGNDEDSVTDSQG